MASNDGAITVFPPPGLSAQTDVAVEPSCCASYDLSFWGTEADMKAVQRIARMLQLRGTRSGDSLLLRETLDSIRSTDPDWNAMYLSLERLLPSGSLSEQDMSDFIIKHEDEGTGTVHTIKLSEEQKAETLKSLATGVYKPAGHDIVTIAVPLQTVRDVSEWPVAEVELVVWSESSPPTAPLGTKALLVPVRFLSAMKTKPRTWLSRSKR